MKSKTQSHINNNVLRIDMLTKMLEIAEQYGDPQEMERLFRNINELNEDTRHLLNGGK